MRNHIYLFAVYLFLNLLMLCGCAEKKETGEELKEAQSSVQQAYEQTTDVIKNVVEEINEAVYD